MRYINFFTTGRLSPIRLASLIGIATALACNTDRILQVSDPDVARPEALQGVTALPTLRAGTIGNFGVAYNGGNADVEQGHVSVLLSQELIQIEKFPKCRSIGKRATS